MNERRTDFELLRDFVRRADQPAFAEVVRRHVGLVYGTALRKVELEGAAQEVVQNVFIALARKAWHFAPDDSLPAWLHRTALLEAKEWLRGELRRRRREQTAAELGTTMKTQDERSVFRSLAPLLDEALLSLREKDRAALLLRFYEGRSLREVGALLGVGEDAAQKRVASAMEKVAAFFRRRGIKTVTVATATAALQQTAVPVSAATATAVVNASLQAAPPAGASMIALLTRVASLSKAQTLALCAAAAVICVGWQWKRTQDVGKEATALHDRLESLRAEQEHSAAEIERLRAQSSALEQNLINAARSHAREQAAGKRLENLRLRSHGLLAAEIYRWPTDLPFVRIPKSALSSIRSQGGPASPASLLAKMSAFLDLSPHEHETVAQVVSNYFSAIDGLVQTSLYETNQAVSFTLPAGTQSRVFVLQPMGESIRSALGQLCAELQAVLGEDRWAMVKPQQFEFVHYEQVRLLGYTQYAWDQRQEIAVNIFSNPGGEPAVGLQADHGAGFGAVPLRLILQGFPLDLGQQGPPALMERVKHYLTAEAVARLSNSANK